MWWHTQVSPAHLRTGRRRIKNLKSSLARWESIAKKKRKPCVSLNISNDSVRWAGPTSFTIMLKYKQVLKSQASTQEVHVESLWSTAKKFWYVSQQARCYLYSDQSPHLYIFFYSKPYFTFAVKFLLRFVSRFSFCQCHTPWRGDKIIFIGNTAQWGCGGIERPWCWCSSIFKSYQKK